MQVAPPLVTLAVMLWGLTESSYSRDDSATLSAVQRPFGALLAMLGKIDAVHGAYYVLLWPIVHAAGSGEVTTRLPSAAAMAVAAAAITGIGRRLVSPAAGLAAGLMFAIVPAVSLYGQTIRPYALTVGFAAAASYLLVRALAAAASGSAAGGWLLAYAACLTVLGYLHIFALLLILAHAVPVGRATLRQHAEAALGRRLAGEWLAAAACAFVLTVPVIWISMAQRANSGWGYSVWTNIVSLTNLIGSPLMALAVALAVLCAITAGAVAGQARLRASWPADLVALCVPWLIVPPAILIAVSQIAPIYMFRYIVFCAPAAALLAGTALAALGWRAGIAAFAIIAVLAVSAQLKERTPTGHGEDVRGVDQVIAADMRPGDVLMYPSIAEPIELAYPYGMGQLRNVDLAQTPASSGTLGGTPAVPRLTRHRLASVSRVWLVELGYGPRGLIGKPPPVLRQLGFAMIRAWDIGGVSVRLYAHAASAVQAGTSGG
jgi:mannosyltransferase